MSRTTDSDMPIWLSVVVIILSLIGVFLLWHMRFDSCMEEKNDRFFCEIYARGG